ncbi:MAG: RNA-binding S4 domain-containing protein [Clostridia bacterium]|nr:RNA-binding S4 domain-containing protein [Clostridia bacterium]
MEIKITTPFIKLDQLLKFSGLCSTGGEAKEVILDGLVKVNGETVLMRGKKIYPGDEVSFENEICKVI